MRELKRSIARAKMLEEGHVRLNRKEIPILDKEGKDTGYRMSYFAAHWKDYFPEYAGKKKNVGKTKKRSKKWIKETLKKIRMRKIAENFGKEE